MSAAITVNELRRNFYLDSVALMRLSVSLAARADVDDAVMMIGTESNKRIMAGAGLLVAAGRDAGPNDLVIALRVRDPLAVDSVLAFARAQLDEQPAVGCDDVDATAPSLEAATARLADANLVLVSTPGEFAAREARKALAQGLNVMLFSDNVPLEEELALKQTARDAGLLVMGPDCGTAYVAGTALAFANVVRQGPVGVVAASGTGLQEVSVLLDRAGSGISHGIGVGGRDLCDHIGGISTMQALELLAADEATAQIILISKPPGLQTAARVYQRLATLGKPVTVCTFGLVDASTLPDSVAVATTLLETVETCLGRRVSQASPATPAAARGRWVCALYSGGTLCAEAQAIFRAAGFKLHSNAPIAQDVGTDLRVAGHRFFDLGADEFTLGRPHPMIEPQVRSAVLDQALADPDVAVVLLDVVLGLGAHADPAAAVIAALDSASSTRPIVIAYVCGTARDPQGYDQSTARLREAGVVVTTSNADAARLALAVVQQPI